MNRHYLRAKSIAGWIKSYLDSDQKSKPEELEAWLAESGRHRAFFDRLLNSANVGKSLEFYEGIDEEGEWKLFRERHRHPLSRRRRVLRWAGSIAASLLLVGGIGLLISEVKKEETIPFVASKDIHPGERKAVFVVGDHEISITGNTDIHHENGTVIVDREGQQLYSSDSGSTGIPQHLIVPYGGEYDLTLGDNTRIWLNSGTELTYPEKFDPACREITIKGEAYLEVAQNPDIPFYVNVDNTRIRVLGTSFMVTNYDNEEHIVVSLVSGSVRMETPSGIKLAELSPLQQFSMNRETGEIGISHFDKQRLLDWKNKLFIFKNEDLSSIARRLERWYNLDIDVDPSLRDNRYSGVIDRHSNLQPIIFILTNTNEMDIIETAPGRIAIQPKPKN